MKIVVTGHDGYLGGVVVPTLRHVGHEVTGLDTGYFADCLLGGAPPLVPATRADVRDVAPEVFTGADAVVHLAALSNDPLGNLDARLTRAINVDATVRVAELARAVGVRRFVFASSCIVYGAADGAWADEDASLDPRTDYAASKVAAEHALATLATDGFSPVFLRNGTVYGASPRQRLDTVFNDFVAAAVTTGRVVVRGDGREWRPVVDIRDVSAAFATAVAAPAADVHARAFNVGENHLNVRIGELAATAAGLVDGAAVEVLAQPGADQRSYRADFGRFVTAFPDVRFRSPAEGGRDLAKAFAELPADAARFVRLRVLRGLLADGRLDGSLRWAEVAR